jgi:hypothetical protein
LHDRAGLQQYQLDARACLTELIAEELAGMRDGGNSIGISDMDKLAQVLPSKNRYQNLY